MTELSFLIELLLNHKLPKKTKDLVQARIRDIEVQPKQQPHYQQPANRPMGIQQSPSMQAKIDEMEAAKLNESPLPIPTVAPATTAAAAQALNLRAQMIQGALNESGGNFEKGRTSARKF